MELGVLWRLELTSTTSKIAHMHTSSSVAAALPRHPIDWAALRPVKNSTDCMRQYYCSLGTRLCLLRLEQQTDLDRHVICDDSLTPNHIIGISTSPRAARAISGSLTPATIQ
jgi:hypothetical protein